MLKLLQENENNNYFIPTSKIIETVAAVTALGRYKD